MRLLRRLIEIIRQGRASRVSTDKRTAYFLFGNQPGDDVSMPLDANRLTVFNEVENSGKLML